MAPDKKMIEQKEAPKIIVMAILVGICCALTYHFHVVLEIGTAFTHFCYIPVILASLWWKRKGLLVAIFLAALLLFSHVFVRVDVQTINDLFRASMLIAVGIVSAILSEKIAKAQARITRERDFSENTIATVPDSLLVLDKDLRIKSANRTFYEKFQAEPDKAIGSGIADILHDKDGTLSTELTKLFETEDMLENFELHYQSEKLGERIFNVRARGLLISEEEEEELIVLSDVTERKRAEGALRMSEAQYHGIFNSTTDTFLIFDLDGNIVEANPQACKMYGYPYEELITLSGKDLVHPDYYHLFEQFKRDVQRTGEFHAESVDIHKDGTSFNIEVTGTGFNYKDRKQLLAVIRDITEQKRMVETLRQSEEKYRSLSESLPDLVYALDSEGKVTYANKVALDTFGYSWDELLSGGVWLNKVIVEGELEIAKKDFGDVLKGKNFVGERTFVRKDGSRFVGEIHSGPVYEGKKVTGARGVIRDTTERKKLEEALRRFSEELELKVEERTKELRKERDYTRHLIESSPDFQLTLDKAGRIMDVNVAFEKIAGKARDELIGESIYEYLPKSTTEKAIVEILEKEKVRDIVLLADIPKKDSILNFSGTIFTTSEEELGIYATGRDMTELRTKEMQLIHAGRLASLGEMATGVAHEINQPLSVISMAAEGTLGDIEKKRFDMSTLPQDLEVILVNVKRIDRIITHMRTFARQPDEIRAVEPEEVLNNALILLSERFKMHDISVSRNVEDNLPAITVDANQLEQVFANIMTNAMQALDERGENAKKEGVCFEKQMVCGISRENGKGWVVFEFADNAFGVPGELRMRVFDPFFTTKEVGQGTGLGLSIAYSIVTRSLSGKIWVDDNDMGGASFKVAIPALSNASDAGYNKE